MGKKKKDTDILQISLKGAKKRRDKKRLLHTTVEPVQLQKTKTVGQLLDQYASMSIQARNLGQCAQVFDHMLRDKQRPTIFLGLAGPLIAGGLRQVICDMIQQGLVDVIVSTGAILYQDLYTARGYRMYKGDPQANDAQLRSLYVDRIYDTYVDEEKFWETDCWVSRFADTLTPGLYSSRAFLSQLGRTIKDPHSIVGIAYRQGVPIFSPAMNDSSLGIGLTEHYHRTKKSKTPRVVIDSIRDNYEITQIVVQSKKTAAIYIAGGVPKNYINDAVVMSYIFGRDTGGHQYAFQITTDAPHWGGLSGSTLKEATSWGKVNQQATTAMAFIEPTVGLPLVVAHALEKKSYKQRKPLSFMWENDELISISQKKHGKQKK